MSYYQLFYASFNSSLSIFFIIVDISKLKPIIQTNGFFKQVVGSNGTLSSKQLTLLLGSSCSGYINLKSFPFFKSNRQAFMNLPGANSSSRTSTTTGSKQQFMFYTSSLYVAAVFGTAILKWPAWSTSELNYPSLSTTLTLLQSNRLPFRSIVPVIWLQNGTLPWRIMEYLYK